MPYLELPHHRLHYRVDESHDEKPWLVFCNSLGTDLHMWDCQAEALEGQFRILRYDRRGHGLSSSPPPPFSMAELGRDVLHLMDSLGIERTHFCGLSIGGLLGQWLALHAAHRFDKIVLCATAARIGSAQSWTERMNAVSAHGLSPLLAGTWSDGLRADLPPQHREWSTPVLHHSSRRQSAAMSDAAQPLPTQISEAAWPRSPARCWRFPGRTIRSALRPVSKL